jgi:hypothetical protein
MKRRYLALAISLATLGVMGVFASASMAEKFTWEANYNAAEYYGEVHCTGVTVVGNAHPFGQDKETCFATTGKFEQNMKTGKEQKCFEATGGGQNCSWTSDAPAGVPTSGKATTNFFYNVPKNLAKFHLVATYES